VPAELALRSASLLDQFSLLDIVDIASDTGEPPADVAPLYFVLSERFGIDAMLTRVTNLPRDDRWDALARGALRDDLYAVLESLVRSVIDASTPGSAPLARYEQWAKANAESLNRAKTALSGIEHMDKPNIAALSVALRTLRSVIKSGSATS
jgi:glutamate dehydrogenase